MLGIRVCDKCNFVYSEHEQFVTCPHQFKQRVDEDHDQTIKGLFHELWGRDVGTPGYRKADWMELQRRLQARGIDI
jgi:hypothetical protein